MATLTSSVPPTTITANVEPAAEKKTIRVRILAHVYDYFAKQAKADDRSLNSYLARLLHKHHAQATSPSKNPEAAE